MRIRKGAARRAAPGRAVPGPAGVAATVNGTAALRRAVSSQAFAMASLLLRALTWLFVSCVDSGASSAGCNDATGLMSALGGGGGGGGGSGGTSATALGLWTGKLAGGGGGTSTVALGLWFGNADGGGGPSAASAANAA